MTDRPASRLKASGNDGSCEDLGGSPAGILREVLREAQARLREQALRHRMELDMLIEQLASSLGEKTAASRCQGASSEEDMTMESVDAAPLPLVSPKPPPSRTHIDQSAADSSTEPPHRDGRLRPSLALELGAEASGGYSSAASKIDDSSSFAQAREPWNRCSSKLSSLHTQSLARDQGLMDERGSRATEPDNYQNRALNRADATRTFPTPSRLERLECALVDGLQGTDSGEWLGKLLRSLVSRLQRLGAAREPERSGCLAKFVDGKWFRTWFTVCICLNAVFLTYTTDYEMAHINGRSSDMIAIVEAVFLVSYVVELSLKLRVHRLYLFWCADASWNVFDFLVVSISVVELGFTVFTEGSFASNVSIMRVFRLFRLVKILRIFRSVRMFNELRLMFDCVLGSFISLMWCFIMIMMIIFVFSLFIVQNIAQDISSEAFHASQAHKQEIYVYFGSVGAAMLTLTKSTTSGIDWGDILDLLQVGHEYASWAFVAFIVFFALAAWNIITSLFIEKALKLAKPDLDTVAMENNMKDAIDAQELTSMFAVVDADGSGTISLEEMSTLMRHPKFLGCLRAKDIDIPDAEFFYNMLVSLAGDSEPEIEVSVVVAACLRMKGAATSMDLHALSFEAKLTNRRLRQHIRNSVERLDRIEQAIDVLITAVMTNKDEAQPITESSVDL